LAQKQINYVKFCESTICRQAC